MPVGTIDDLIACEAEGVKDYTVNGACSNCGQCCSDVLPVSDQDVRRIAEYVKARHIGDYGNKLLWQAVDLICPFRDDARHRCAIYPVRPEICRAFRCDHDPDWVAETKAFYHRKYRVISMRMTFFGGTDNGSQHEDRLV